MTGLWFLTAVGGACPRRRPLSCVKTVSLGRLDAVERTHQELTERLKAMRARPSAATSKLFQELLDC